MKIVYTILLMMFAASVFAQSNTSVEGKLNITDAQKVKIEKINAKFAADKQVVKSQKEQIALKNQYRKQIREVLTPEQQVQLRKVRQEKLKTRFDALPEQQKQMIKNYYAKNKKK